MRHVQNKHLRVVTDINLKNPFGSLTVEHLTHHHWSSPHRLFRRLADADAIILRLPSKYTAMVALAARQFSRGRLVYYDVNIPVVANQWEWLKRKTYLSLVRRADMILTLQADTREYARLLSLPEHRLRYVGFKSNGWEDSGAVERGRQTVEAGNYVLACGRSYRDFATFTVAMAEAGLPARILLTQGSLAAEGSIPPAKPLPDNVSLIKHDGSRSSWVDAILGARIVIVPLRRDVIQPAGVSVYLEAMNLSRPVIVSEGPSTRSMLDDCVAGLVPPGDSSALARETLRLWHDTELRSRRIAQAQEYVQRLGGVERMSRDILGATIQLLGERLVRHSVRAKH